MQCASLLKQWPTCNLHFRTFKANPTSCKFVTQLPWLSQDQVSSLESLESIWPLCAAFLATPQTLDLDQLWVFFTSNNFAKNAYKLLQIPVKEDNLHIYILPVFVKEVLEEMGHWLICNVPTHHNVPEKCYNLTGKSSL